MTSSRLVVPPTVRATLFSHARAGIGDGPREVCGILAGERGIGGNDGSDRVTEIHRVTNVADTPRVAYELDPAETLATIETIEETGQDVVGFYHSHPDSPARPSATDEAQATWTGYVYCIVSPTEDAVRAWRWTGECFDALDVVDADTA
ncbi:desampylase [Halogranum rubrum]|uniref:MPN domain-containing protein n=1 Tax=Halogranum salarium B-1 TaxID=1210908 RepID=J3JFM0_9EURY|nr:desampylase [Halogranum salarium]EJN59341.1 hypothetical protein HSB1_27620 [Halogranum salarium B-1]